MVNRLSFLFCFFFIITIPGLAIDYSEVATIEEVIEIESYKIQISNSLEEKIEALLDRAESYLLAKNSFFALKDYDKANLYIEQLPHKQDYLFRSLLGQTVAYSLNGNEDSTQTNIKQMKILIKKLQCNDCFHLKKNFKAKAQVIREIYGPDKISIEACVNKVKNTGRGCVYFASLAPSLKARILLFELIHQVEEQALSCCRSGGLWKACIGPLLEKWVQWNEKWKMFGQPPDTQND